MSDAFGIRRDHLPQDLYGYDWQDHAETNVNELGG